MKVKGFFSDVTSVIKVTNRRKELIKNASSQFTRVDNISKVAKQLHPGKMTLEVINVEKASLTSTTLRFATIDKKLPVFQAGQYISLNLKIGKTITTRAYSISSSPFETRGENPFVEITVRKNGNNFAPEHICNLKVGDRITANMPYGQFYYEPLRDSKNLVAIAGGSGITPFYSMAREIQQGKMDCNLTIIYGSNDLKDIVLKEKLDEIKCDKIKIVYVIANDPSWTGEKGYITKEIIEKYSRGDVTYFMCGPKAMYDFVQGELKVLKIPKRRIRTEVFGTAQNPKTFADYPVKKTKDIYKMTIIRGLREDLIEARADETVAVALERSGIEVETRCRSGECGYCRSELLSGDIYVVKEGDGRRAADKIHGFFHPCGSYPVSDLVIKIPII